MLAAAMTAATIIYGLIPVLASSIIADLGVTRAEIGMVLGGGSLAAASAAPAMGGFIDRIGARNGVVLVFAAAAIGTALVSLAVGFVTLAAATLVASMGNAFSNPATNKMISINVAHRLRGLITGVKQSGVQVGTAVAGFSFPHLALWVTWRGVAALVAAVFVVLGVLSHWLLPASDDDDCAASTADPPPELKAHHQRESAPNSSGGSPRPPLPPVTRPLAVYAFLMGAGGSPIFSFLALYVEEQLGADPRLAGWIVGLGGLCGFAGRISWSVVAGRTHRFGSILLIQASLALVAGVTLLSAPTLGLWVAWVVSAAAGFSISAWNSVAMLFVVNDATPQQAGHMSGVVVSGFLGGLAVAPPLFGWSVDALGSYQPGFAVASACFAAASTVMVWWLFRSRGNVGRSLAAPAVAGRA